MSTKTWGIRLNKEVTDLTETAIDVIIAEQNFTGRDRRPKAFKHIMERAVLGFPTEETPYSIKATLDACGCEFIRYEAPDYVCLETMRKNKKPVILGDIPKRVIDRCVAHKRGVELLQEEARQKEARSDSIQKLLSLRRVLLKVSRGGFQADAHFCFKDILTTGIMNRSVDGLHLPCTLEEVGGAIVKIEDVCKQVLNPQTQAPPCLYYMALAHDVKIKDLAASMPPGSFDLEYPLLGIDRQETSEVEADFVVLDEPERPTPNEMCLKGWPWLIGDCDQYPEGGCPACDNQEGPLKKEDREGEN